MKKQLIEIYAFDELNESARFKAIDSYRRIVVSDLRRNNSSIARDLRRAGKINGFKPDTIQFDVNRDDFAFSGRIVDFMDFAQTPVRFKNFILDPINLTVAKQQLEQLRAEKDSYSRITANIYFDANYRVYITAKINSNSRIDLYVKDTSLSYIETIGAQWLTHLCHNYSVMLRYRITDEKVQRVIESRACKFGSDGTIIPECLLSD